MDGPRYGDGSGLKRHIHFVAIGFIILRQFALIIRATLIDVGEAPDGCHAVGVVRGNIPRCFVGANHQVSANTCVGRTNLGFLLRRAFLLRGFGLIIDGGIVDIQRPISVPAGRLIAALIGSQPILAFLVGGIARRTGPFTEAIHGAAVVRFITIALL